MPSRRRHAAFAGRGARLQDDREFFPQDFAKQAVEQAERGLRDLSAKHVPAEVPVRRVVAYGRIYEEILSAATSVECDLIVIASQRPEIKDYLIGPNADRVARHADREVLIVRD